MIKSGILLRICLLLAVTLCAPIRANAASQAGTDGTDAVAAAAPFQGDVYILSGGFGVFSTGLNKLKTELKQKGVTFSLEPTDFNPTTRIAFINAPDGVSIELLNRKENLVAAAA